MKKKFKDRDELVRFLFNEGENIKGELILEYKEKILPIEYHIESIEFDIGFLSPEL